MKEGHFNESDVFEYLSSMNKVYVKESNSSMVIDELIKKYEGLLEEQVSDSRKNYHNYDRGDFMRNASYRKAYLDFIIDLKELKRTLSLDEENVR